MKARTLVSHEKWMLLCLVAIYFCTTSRCLAQQVTSLDDIEFWVGEGPQRAALAIDWNGETSTDEALVWGYYWEGTATAGDFLSAVLAADERLYAKLVTIPSEGVAIIGIGYDANNDRQFGITGGATFDERGIYQSPSVSDGEVALDPLDLYSEGWFLGFWHVGINATDPFGNGTWVASETEFNAIPLVNGGAVGLAFTSDTESNDAFPETEISAAAPVFANGDFNDDGLVDGADWLQWQTQLADGETLALWQTQYGQSLTLATPIPEPTSCLLAGALLMNVLKGRRKQFVKPTKRFSLDDYSL